MNTSNQTIKAVDYFYEGLVVATHVFNYYSVGIHIVYLALMIIIPDLRKRPLVFINHAVAVSILYPSGILVFQFVNPALIADKNLVNVLCSFFEYFWPVTVYMRMFSILLIAVHRYIGVFKIDLFRRINQSILPPLVLILVTWTVAILLNVIDKYAFSTTYSITFCLDGFAPTWLLNLLYAVYFVVLSMFVPCIIIVVIYVLISRKLKSVGTKLAPERTTISISISLSSDQRINKRREQRFANQFVLMCLAVVLNICGISIYSVRALVPNYFLVFFYWRFIVRIWILCMVSLVPILSLWFNPAVRHRISRASGLNSSVSRENSTPQIKQQRNTTSLHQSVK